MSQQHRPTPPQPRAYIICTAPRSGSTLLCGLLSAAHAGNPGSYFHKPSRAEWRSYHRLSDTAPLGDIFAAAVTKGSKGGLFGFRLQRHSFAFFTDQLAQLHPEYDTDKARLEAAFGAIAFIHLTRTDKATQAISCVKAKQSGLWHVAPDGSEIERLAPPQKLRYDGTAIRQEYDEFLRFDADWRSWFEAQGIHPYRLTYETLSASPKAALADLLAHLGKDPSSAAQIEIPTKRLSDDTNADWAERFRADLQEHPA